MFFWHSSRTTLWKSLVFGTLFASSLGVFGQENQGESPIFPSPNKPVLGIMSNQNSVDDFSFLNKKDEPNKSLLPKNSIWTLLHLISNDFENVRKIMPTWGILEILIWGMLTRLQTKQ